LQQPLQSHPAIGKQFGHFHDRLQSDIEQEIPDASATCHGECRSLRSLALPSRNRNIGSGDVRDGMLCQNRL